MGEYRGTMGSQPSNHFGSHHVLDRPGCRIHYWTVGPDTAPSLVVTHGAFMNHEVFAPQIDAFAGEFRIIAWDIRGHGSSRPCIGPFSVAAVAADLIALLEHERVDRAVLLGHSLGGYVVQEALVQRPDLASALIVIGATSLTARPGPITRVAMRVLPLALRHWPLRHIKRAAVRHGTRSPATRDYVRSSFASVSRSDLVEVLGAVVRCGRPDNNYRLPIPALVLRGDEDNAAGMARAHRRWAANDSNVEVFTVLGSGHAPQLERPQQVNDAIARYLARVEA